MASTTLTVRVHLKREGRQTDAIASVKVGDRTFQGSGRAMRNPTDAPARCVGEELAIARALSDLASALRTCAAEDISERVGHHVVLSA